MMTSDLAFTFVLGAATGAVATFLIIFALMELFRW